MNYWLFIIPIISAFVGWAIQKLAVSYLFHPRQPKKIAGLTFQGIFPKRQHELAKQLGTLAAREFASFNMEEKIADPANFEKLTPMIESHVDDFLRNKLKEQMPMISMFIGDKTIVTLKTVFMQELQQLFPQVMKQFAGNIQSGLDPQTLVTNKISAIAPGELEQILAPRLRIFSIAGAVSGFLIGLIQVILTLLVK